MALNCVCCCFSPTPFSRNKSLVVDKKEKAVPDKKQPIDKIDKTIATDLKTGSEQKIFPKYFMQRLIVILK